MPTAFQINQACREGLYVFTGNRQQVSGAVAILGARGDNPGKPAAAGKVWVNMRRTGLWEEVDQSKVIITNELFSKEKSMPIELIGKKSGKRETGRPGLPSETKATGNGKAESSKDDKAPEDKKKKGKWKPKSTVSLVKQGDLPGVNTGQRRDEAIESLAEKFEETKLAKAAADKAHKESDELLVALMRRKKKTFYSRSTWGAVSVPDPVVHAKFTREKTKKKK